VIGPSFLNGAYDEEGHWQRTKFCFMACPNCDCGPPGGLIYNAAYDKRLQQPKPQPEEAK
jgi:hypothetical protein